MDKTRIDPNRLYSLPEVGAATGVGYQNARYWMLRGYLPAIKIGPVYAVYGRDLLQTLYRYRLGEIELDKPRHGFIRELVPA